MTVEASAATLQTEKADTSSEISSNVVKALPLRFHSYQSLVNLVPGATPAAFQNSILDAPSRSLTTNINGTNRNRQHDAHRRSRFDQRLVAAPRELRCSGGYG
ncbi:MAG: hypothetical protein R2748_07840 [Bryobacterales bacterium]